MIHFRSNIKLRFNRALVFVIIISVILSSAAVYVDIRLREVAKNFAKSAVKTALINATNSACERVMRDTDITYDQLAVISRNEQGLATSVEINTISANYLKSLLTNAIAKELASIPSVSFSIPIGTAFGIHYSYFDIPKINYTVHITTTVGSDFESAFYSAGINQVLHQILLTVNMESDLAMKRSNTETLTSIRFLVAQTVIVGAVPDAFTEVGSATDEVMEDIFDFGAGVTN